MPAEDTITCGSCLTLNPAAAPACVRCNSPLARAAPTLPPAARPAPAQPEPAPAAAAPPRPARVRRDDRLHALSPAAQRRVVRRIELIGGAVVLAVLVVGGLLIWRHAPRTLDPVPVQTDIATQLSQRLGQQVQVGCPGNVTVRAGATFSCTATDAGGDRRTVDVTITSGDGAYRWQLR